jgi:hypothetical protein
MHVCIYIYDIILWEYLDASPSWERGMVHGTSNYPRWGLPHRLWSLVTSLDWLNHGFSPSLAVAMDWCWVFLLQWMYTKCRGNHKHQMSICGFLYISCTFTVAHQESATVFRQDACDRYVASHAVNVPEQIEILLLYLWVHGKSNFFGGSLTSRRFSFFQLSLSHRDSIASRLWNESDFHDGPFPGPPEKHRQVHDYLSTVTIYLSLSVYLSMFLST